MLDPLVLTVEAAKQAIADAGLEPDDIDGMSTYPGPLLGAGMSEGGVTALEDILRLRPTWINSGLELPGQAGSVIAAMLAVAGGCATTCCASAPCGKPRSRQRNARRSVARRAT